MCKESEDHFHRHEHHEHHEHNHEHHEHHEHNHEHHNHHEHEHGSSYSTENGQTYTIDGHLHEGAVIGTGVFSCQGNEEIVQNLLQSGLKDLGSWITCQGGIIGHIKASMETRHTTMFSLTEEDTHSISQQSKEFQINIAAIVFSVDLESLKSQIASLCEKLLHNI